jgi:hypothetical protein
MHMDKYIWASELKFPPLPQLCPCPSLPFRHFIRPLPFPAKAKATAREGQGI